MGVLTGFFAQAAVSKGRPEFSDQCCLNKKQAKYVCSQCADTCPSEAITGNPARKQIRWDKCTNCGICVSVCPTRCFEPELKIRKLVSDPVKTTVLGLACARTETGADVRTMDCLCMLPWEWVAAMALQLPVVLHLESCRDCPEKDRREQLERNLGQVEQFLGAAFGRQIMLVTDQEQPEPEAQGVEMDRRGFLTSIRTEMKRTVAYGVTSVLPMSREGNGSLVYRSYLAGAVRKKREEARNGSGEIPLYRVLLPDYNRNCFACGICEKICPQHAIAVSGEQNGKRTIHISPERCTGCGLCARLCPWNGMNGLAWTAVPHLDRQPLVSVASESCRQCQKVIRPGTEGGLCPSCTLKYRRKRK